MEGLACAQSGQCAVIGQLPAHLGGEIRRLSDAYAAAAVLAGEPLPLPGGAMPMVGSHWL